MTNKINAEVFIMRLGWENADAFPLVAKMDDVELIRAKEILEQMTLLLTLLLSIYRQLHLNGSQMNRLHEND